MAEPESAMRVRPALVVFADSDATWWMRFLKPGFRHCFACIESGGLWVVVDPMSHVTEVRTVSGQPAPTLQAWFEDRGLLVRPTTAVEPPRVAAPVRPFTCVEAVKRLIGLRDPWVVTPWQLYRRLGMETAAYPACVMRSISSP